MVPVYGNRGGGGTVWLLDYTVLTDTLMSVFALAMFGHLWRKVVLVAKRGRMSRGHSKHQFRQGAMNVHQKNTAGPMRGGIRL